MTIACPSPPDAAAWGAANRVVLYPNKVQTWVLARAVDRDLPGDLELRKMARAVMAKWFSDAPVADVAGRSGQASEIEVGAVSVSPIPLATTLQTWAKLPGPAPLLKAGKVMYVPVRFIWRSQSETSRPWPTWRVNWGFGGPCPVEADWMLYSVGTDKPALIDGPPEAALPPAAPEKSVGEQAQELIEQNGPAVIGAVELLGAGLLVLGVGYTVNAFRR